MTFFPPPRPFPQLLNSWQLESREQGEGAGARVRRSIGRPELRNLDPFLMLDEFRVPKGAGFPDHPHRGFETVTYMLSGVMEHEDFCGHRGKIGPGDLQWMTAGRGVVHAEMPASEDEPAHGLQLWVNLAAKDKMVEPQYQELVAKDIPHVEKDGVTAIIIAGKAFGTEVRPVSSCVGLCVRVCVSVCVCVCVCLCVFVCFYLCMWGQQRVFLTRHYCVAFSLCCSRQCLPARPPTTSTSRCSPTLSFNKLYVKGCVCLCLCVPVCVCVCVSVCHPIFCFSGMAL